MSRILFVCLALLWSATASAVESKCTYQASSGDFDTDYCEEPNKVALVLYEWIGRSGDVSDAIADRRAKSFLSPELYAKYVKGRGDFQWFFTPVGGQDFYLAKDVPISIVKTEVKAGRNETTAKVMMHVTFDEAYGRKPAQLTSKLIVLLMRQTKDGGFKIYNANNGSRWLNRSH